jgi:hypothetical protein
MNEAKLTKFDEIFLSAMSAIWKLISVFNPRPIQERYARRIPANAVMTNRVLTLPDADSGQSIVRLGNNKMKSDKRPNGIVSRNDLVKIVNPANGRFVILYAMGAGSHPIPGNGIALDYDARVTLGVQKLEEVDLMLGAANAADCEFFSMYLDSDKSSRSARVLGWYLFMAGFAWSCVSVAESVVTTFIDSGIAGNAYQAVISSVAFLTNLVH